MATTMCDPCRTRSRSISASFWCPFCREAFCKVCNQFHQTMKLTKTHKVRPITEVSPRDRQVSGAASQYDLDPSLTPLTFSEKTQLREIDNILVVMDGLSDTALTLKQMCFDLKMRNESQTVECMKKVALFRDRLKQLADDFERHISAELEYLQHAENIQIQGKIEECESMFNTIELTKDIAYALKAHGVTPQSVNKVNAARQRCKEFKYTLQRIHSRMQPVHYDLAIDSNVSEALTSNPGIIGKVEVSHDNDDFFDVRDDHRVPVTSTRENILSHRTRVTHPSRNLQLSSGHAQRSHEILPQRKDDHDEPMITAICMMDNGHFLTLDRNNNKILLIQQDGVIVTQYVFTSQIWGMTLVDSITAAVTVPDNDKIILVKVRNKNLCAEKLIKTSNICFGLCSVEGFIVVTVKGGYVKIMTKAGEEVASLRHNHRGEILFTDPQHVATNREQNELFVTDNTLHTVTGLFLSGVKIEPKPKFVFRNNDLRNPTGLCLDVNGNIYVCGFSTHNVIKLSPEGQLLHVLLSGVINPQALAFSIVEDQLFVSVLSNCAGRSKQMQNVIAVFKI